jgi:hypothetical protein
MSFNSYIILQKKSILGKILAFGTTGIILGTTAEVGWHKMTKGGNIRSPLENRLSMYMYNMKGDNEALYSEAWDYIHKKNVPRSELLKPDGVTVDNEKVANRVGWQTVGAMAGNPVNKTKAAWNSLPSLPFWKKK